MPFPSARGQSADAVEVVAERITTSNSTRFIFRPSLFFIAGYLCAMLRLRVVSWQPQCQRCALARTSSPPLVCCTKACTHASKLLVVDFFFFPLVHSLRFIAFVYRADSRYSTNSTVSFREASRSFGGLYIGVECGMRVCGDACSLCRKLVYSAES